LFLHVQLRIAPLTEEGASAARDGSALLQPGHAKLALPTIYTIGYQCAILWPSMTQSRMSYQGSGL